MLLYISKCMLAMYNVLTDAVCSTYQPQLPYMQQCITIGITCKVSIFLCTLKKCNDGSLYINMHASSHAIMLPHKVWCA